MQPVMTIADAEKHIQEHQGRSHAGNSLYFDYVKNKPIKTDIGSNKINSKAYDEYNGEGSARSAIKQAFDDNVVREKYPEEHARFDDAFSRAGVSDLNTLSDDQCSKLLGYALYGKGDGNIK